MKVFGAALFFFSVWALGLARGVAAEPVYAVGVVPQFEARHLHQIWQPVLTHLEAETGYRFELVGSPTIDAFEAEFLDGEFDFVYMNPYHLIMASKTVGYLPLVRDVGRELYGVLVVEKSGEIKAVKDLSEKIIVFPASNALGASLQMRQELTDIFKLEFSSRYVKTHDSVYLNVLLGEASAGGGVQRTLDQQKESIRNSLRIIHRTRPVPPHPFAVHSRIPKQVSARVKKALLNMGASESGRALLEEIPIKQIGTATLEEYEVIRTMGLERFYVKQN